MACLDSVGSPVKVSLGGVRKLDLEVVVAVGVDGWGLGDSGHGGLWLEAHLSSHEQEHDFDDHADEVEEQHDVGPELDGSGLPWAGGGTLKEELEDPEVPDQEADFLDEDEDAADVHEGVEAEDGVDDHEEVHNPEDGPGGSWLSGGEEGDPDEDDPSGDPGSVVELSELVTLEEDLFLVHVAEVVTDGFSGAVLSESDNGS